MKQTLTAAGVVLLAGVLIWTDAGASVPRAALALVALVGVPALVLYRRTSLLGDAGAARAAYALGCTLLGLTALGLVLNTVLPHLGVDRPLAPHAIGPAVIVVDLALLGWRHRRPLVPEGWLGDTVGRALAARLEPAQALAAGALVLAVTGAVRLNNGAGGGVAIASLVLAIAAVGVLLARRDSTQGADVRCLWLVAAALLLATSLRGWTITGHDIQSEYLTFRLTDQAQRWSVASWRNAYNACLSLNVLPTVLVQATGISGVVVFKLLFQLVFAVVPALNFLLARRFLPRRVALAAAVAVMAFPTFYTDMPYLIRQEIAFLFLCLMLLAATSPGARRARLAMSALFGVGVVVSHYSTTYVMLLGLGSGMLALGVFRLGRRLRRRRTSRLAPLRPAPGLVLLNPLLIAILAAAGWGWSGPATHTGTHAADVARAAVHAILHPGGGDGSPGSSDLSYVFWHGSKTTPRDRFDGYVDQVVAARKGVDPRLMLFPHLDQSMTRPPLVDSTAAPDTGAGSVLAHTGVKPRWVSTGMRLLATGVLQLLLVVGLVGVLLGLRRRRRRALSPDRSARLPEEAVFAVFGTLAALVLVVALPTLSVDYGILRAFEQALLVVSPVVAMGLWAIARRARRLRGAVLVGVPVLLLVGFGGLAPAVLGGYSPRLATSNSGLYYERYYAGDSDADAVDWVTTNGPGDDGTIVANRNIGVRVLSTDPSAHVADRLYPALLAHGDYVFVDSQLQTTRKASVFYTGDLLTYRYPLAKVEHRLDLVYSADDTRIYR